MRYGFAVDIGTTNIEISLWDLDSYDDSVPSETSTSFRAIPLKTKIVRNCLCSYGADVVSRILYAHYHSVSELQNKLIVQLNAEFDSMLREAQAERCADKSGFPSNFVQDCATGGSFRAKRAVFTGNTVMLHFLSGFSVAGFEKAPFTPVSLFGGVVSAGSPPASLADEVIIPPCISAFLGADIVCAAIAAENAVFCDKARVSEPGGLASDNPVFCDTTRPGTQGGFAFCGMSSCPTTQSCEPGGLASDNPVFCDATRPDMQGGFAFCDATRPCAQCIPTVDETLPYIVIDIGTNTEILLVGADGRKTACSAAAGPAFEGGGLSVEMKGSALVAELARMLDEGVMDETGYIGSAEGMTMLTDRAGVSSFHGKTGTVECESNIEEYKPGTNKHESVTDGCESVADERDPGTDGRRTRLNQQDVRQLQLAKGATAAAVETLLRSIGLEAAGIKRCFICGNFGNALALESVEKTGLLPAALAKKSVYFGNAALRGAELILLSKTAALHHAAEIVTETSVLQLADSAFFAEKYIQRMNFTAF